MTENNTQTTEQQIEALLFWKGEPMTIKELAKYLDTNEGSIKLFLNSLEESLKSRGIVLVQRGDEVTLGTSPETSALIEKITKEELSRDLGRAALETLAIILYKGPIKRSEIDYIRGVNSNFILRNLLIRGLVERAPAPDDQRVMVYSASFDLMNHLGITKLEDLPDFANVQEEIKRFKETHHESIEPKRTDTDTGAENSTATSTGNESASTGASGEEQSDISSEPQREE